MINLNDISTKAPSIFGKKDTKEETKRICDEIADLQYKMYAEKKHSLLVVFQGMDSSGKDGCTKNVFRSCSPLGIYVKPFKKPTPLEMAHDFLWRAHEAVPAKGDITVFTRSHYEDILIQRVHKWIDKDKVQHRINAINAFEELLQNDNNTTVIKCYLHLSKERQEEKLQERLDMPEKHWKHNAGDWKEREHWDEYMEAYHDVLNKCNAIPWHVIPADQRWYRNYCAAKVVLETLQRLNPQFPVVAPEKLVKG